LEKEKWKQTVNSVVLKIRLKMPRSIDWIEFWRWSKYATKRQCPFVFRTESHWV